MHQRAMVVSLVSCRAGLPVQAPLAVAYYIDSSLT